MVWIYNLHNLELPIQWSFSVVNSVSSISGW